MLLFYPSWYYYWSYCCYLLVVIFSLSVAIARSLARLFTLSMRGVCTLFRTPFLALARAFIQPPPYTFHIGNLCFGDAIAVSCAYTMHYVRQAFHSHVYSNTLTASSAIQLWLYYFAIIYMQFARGPTFLLFLSLFDRNAEDIWWKCQNAVEIFLNAKLTAIAIPSSASTINSFKITRVYLMYELIPPKIVRRFPSPLGHARFEKH